MILKPKSLLIILLVPLLSNAQTDLGSWNIFNVKYTINPSLSFFAEAQLRSLRFYNQFHYYEFKGGINYKIHKNASLTLASGTYQTYREGGNFVLPKNNDEFRIWPQILVTQSIYRFNIEQRYRMELRFTSNGYRNRFRYRVGIAYPFGKSRKGFKPFQLALNNEIFFTDKEPYFERNRVSTAFTYKASKNIAYQIGYLHQFDYKINDETGRDFLQIGMFIEFFKKDKSLLSRQIEIIDN